MFLQVGIFLGLAPWLVRSLATTDSISDADLGQSGYLSNHNMQPAIVSSPSFGILWTNTYLAKEKWYAKPLVYTPPGKKQLVFIASTRNYIRTLDAVTGALINQRQVMPPFLQSDLGCTDIPDYIGIVGTPVIDPSTDTAYFFAKGYRGEDSSGGVAKGIYKFYAVSVLDLTDRPGFPVLVDGHNADNDPTRYFLGGTVLQRPALTLVGGNVFGGFGGHCDKFNYTGMMVSVSTTSGVGVTGLFAMEAAPAAPPVDEDFINGQGGGAGIWMSGMAPATDGTRIFVTTGNGKGHENKETPASGRDPLSTLDEVIANLGIADGKFTLQDYFEPYEYIGMDAGDRDLGSGGVSLLDPSVFKATNGVTRLATTVGKNGKLYICNADNLGGYRNGAGGTDNIIQTINSPGAVFGGVGSYPLEGGYVYFTPVGSPTLVYSFGLDQKGGPLFSKVGESPDKSAGRVGVGVPTITTFKGQTGTGILWVTDVDAGLKAYYAVPNSDQKLVKINIPPTGGLNKFQRPAFGDGRLYVSDNNAHIICMGSPVSLPLNCTSPVDFGDLPLGATAIKQVNCTALIPITKLAGIATASPAFQAANDSLPQGSLAVGDKFSFPVTWNLTNENIVNAPGASFGSVAPGVKSSSLVIHTVNGVDKFSNSLPISLVGTEVSNLAFLSVSPTEVDFGGIVVNGTGAATGLDNSFIIANVGKQPLKILGYGYVDDLDPPVVYENVTFGMPSVVGEYFTSNDLPPVGRVLAAGESLTVPVKFKADEPGSYQNILHIWTTGGDQNILMTGSASTAPKAVLEVETSEGGWDPSLIMDFGDVTAGKTVTRRIRMCNTGGSGLLITKSKPPIQTELRASNPLSDLHEGQVVDVNSCAYAPIDIAASPSAPNVPDHQVSDTWTLNTDDLTLGIRNVEVKANIVARQVGPVNGTTGLPQYRYLGCYQDGQGRQLSKQYNLGQQNDNGACQQKCKDNGYVFAGTEYHVQCWCGNNPPAVAKYLPESAKKCTFSCTGDTSQACGGDGAYISIYYDASRYTPGCSAFPCSSSSSSSFIAPSSTSSLAVSSVSTLSSTSASGSITLTGSGASSSNILTGSATSVSGTSSFITLAGSVTSVSSMSNSASSSGFTSSVTLPSFSSSSTSLPPATPTGPVTNPGNSDYRYEACYQDVSTKAIYPNVKYSTDLMTVAICLAYCKSKGSSYAGIEYRRECYCGNDLATDAVKGATGCSLTCFANATEYCGGSSRMNLYKAAVLSSTVASSSLASSSLTISSISSVSSGFSSTGSISSSAVLGSSLTQISSLSAASSSIVSSSTLASSSAVSASSAQTGRSSVSASSSAPASSTVAASSSSPASSSAAASSSNLATSSNPASSSLITSSSAWPSSSVGMTSTSIGGSSSLSLTRSSSQSNSYSASPASSSSVPPRATNGFYYAGCYIEPASAKAMKLVTANDSMSFEFCVSAAKARLTAVPATTYRFVGLEYGRECYGATAAVANQTSLVGNKACPLTCSGNSTQSCGGRGMYNYYITTAVTTSSSSIPVSTTGTIVTSTMA